MANGGVRRRLTFDLMYEMRRLIYQNKGLVADEIRCSTWQLEAYGLLFPERERRLAKEAEFHGHSFDGVPMLLDETGMVAADRMLWVHRERGVVGVLDDLLIIHIDRIEVQADDPDRFVFGIVSAFTKKITGEMAIPGPNRDQRRAEAARLRWHGITFDEPPHPPPTLIDGLTLEQCRERWLVNRSEQEIPSGCKRPVYDLTPAQIEAGKRYRRIQDTAAEAMDASVLRVMVKTSDTERQARQPRVLVDLEDE